MSHEPTQPPIKYPQQEVGNRVSSGKPAVWLVVNQECNWRAGGCTHCYLPSHTEALPVADALDRTQKLTAQGFTVIPAAGEVLINPGYIGVYQAAGAQHLLTNGILLASKKGPELADTLAKAGISQVGLTLHEGSPHNIFNGVPPEVVAKAVDTVKQAGLTPTATAVVAKPNLDRVPAIVRLAAELGFWALRFNRLIPTNQQLQNITLSPQDTDQFFQMLQEQRQLYPKDSLRIHASGLFGLKGRHKQVSPDYHYCPAGRNIFALDHQGNVFPCLLLMKAEYQIGHYDPATGQLILKENEFTQGKHGQHDCSAYELLYLDQHGQ